MSERFFRSNRPEYPHPVSSELVNSGIRVTVGDCSVTERRRRRPPYQTGKTVHVHAKHYKHNEDGRTAPGVCGNSSVLLSHSGNVVTRIGIHTHTQCHFVSWANSVNTSSQPIKLSYKNFRPLIGWINFHTFICTDNIGLCWKPDTPAPDREVPSLREQRGRHKGCPP